MLIPRFSISWILGLTAACAVLSWIAARALAGAAWAMATSAAVGLMAACFLFYGVTFLLAYALARLTRALRPPDAPRTPFASEHDLPPQLVPQSMQSDEL